MGKRLVPFVNIVTPILAGKKIVKDNTIKDPAVRIRAALIEDFAQRYGLSALPAGGTLVPWMTTDVAKVIEASPAADLLMDVQTTFWGFRPFPTDWNSYHVFYAVTVRLIDTQSHKTLAEGSCKRYPDKTPDAPSLDQLLVDDAVRLKDELGALGDQCLTELKTKVFAPLARR